MVRKFSPLFGIKTCLFDELLLCRHGPVVGFVIMIILIFEIGYAPALAGLGCLICLFPFQNIFAADIGKIRRKMIQFSDERVKLINESLQAIRVIKLYAWEKPIEQRVNHVRQQESFWLRKYLDAAARLRELMFSAQPICALVIVTTAAYGAKHPLTLVQIFRVLAFLNITRLPLNLLGQALKNVNDGLVSLQRLNTFFLQQTLPINSNKRFVDHPQVDMKEVSFSWQDSDRINDDKGKSEEKTDGNSAIIQPQYFRLQKISFSTKSSNELIAIIGTVGSGKSSFLSSILGEMVRISGQCQVAGSISYCAQTPWIQNLTLQQNVLFEQPSSTLADSPDLLKKYNQAIEAAALLPDIRILPHGDLTESKFNLEFFVFFYIFI